MIMGVILSTLHQSSLGSLFLIMPEKINPLWYTPLAAGVLLCLGGGGGPGHGHRGIDPEQPLPLPSWRRNGHPRRPGLGGGVGIGAYLVVRFGDMAVRRCPAAAAKLSFSAFCSGWRSASAPCSPCCSCPGAGVRSQPKVVFRCAALIVFGVVLYRMNMAIFSFWNYTGNVYIPSLVEVLVTLTLVSAGVVAFGLIAKFFPVFSAEHQGNAH